MKNRMITLGVLLLVFVALTGMSLPRMSSPGCECGAHASMDRQAIQ
jgi:hypothetical protein